MPSRRVDAAKSCIAGVESGHASRLRVNPRGDAHRGGAGRIYGGPHAGANGSEKRSTVRSAFFGFDDFYRMAVDIGLNLPPKR